MQMLFIGGSYDGKRMDVREGVSSVHLFSKASKEQILPVEVKERYNLVEVTNKERYNLVELQDKLASGVYKVMVSELEVFPVRRLIEGYKGSV